MMQHQKNAFMWVLKPLCQNYRLMMSALGNSRTFRMTMVATSLKRIAKWTLKTFFFNAKNFCFMSSFNNTFNNTQRLLIHFQN